MPPQIKTSMATQKNQHFVPKCYLKRFSDDGDGKCINLYNLDLRRAIPRAPLKNQCSRNYFYGEDLTVERALGHVEGTYATVIEEILGASYELTQEHKDFLRIFWTVQHLRTEAVSMRTAEMSADFERVGGLPAGEYRMSIGEAIVGSLKMLPTAIESVSDLKIVLLRNKTTLPFVTSDDPAVLTNRWAQSDPRKDISGSGLQNSGALCTLPLSPEVTMLGYDGNVYSVDHDRGWVEIARNADVTALNQIQMLNCRANLYFAEWDHRDSIDQQFSAAAGSRPPARHRIHYAVLDSVGPDGTQTFREVSSHEAEDHQHAIIHSETIDPVPTHWPSIIRWRASGHVWQANDSASYHRRAHAVSGQGVRYTKQSARPAKV